MLRVKVLVVDRTRASFLKEGEAFYLERLKKYIQVDWVEVKSVKIGKGRSLEEVTGKEAKALANKLSPGDHIVALDRTGRLYDTEKLAAWLGRLSTQARGWVCFVIGGPLGLPREFLDQARDILSLSRLTLTHEMSRLVLLEQLYRSLTILKGEKYHK
jgi:23S rRNA (pseudouridine1915-N3)-methyltransferase